MTTAISARGLLARLLPTSRATVQAGGGSAPSASGDTFTPASASDPRSGMTAAQRKAFDALSRADQDSYGRVAATVDRSSAMALAQLLEAGTLQSKDLGGQGTLLTHLRQLATEPTAPGLDRRDVLGSLVKQAQRPGLISQEARGTCTVTSIEYMLATRSPAEYARLVAGLASTSGTVKLADGHLLQRSPGTERADDSGRTGTSRLYEAAMMDYGNGILSYSNAKDKNGLGSLYVLPGGLVNFQVAHAVSSTFDETWKAKDAVPVIGTIPYTGIGGARLVRELQAALNKGESVPMGLDWRGKGEWKPAGHEVLALKIENGRVYYRNPWGAYSAPGTELEGKDGPPRRIEDNNGVESMTLAELQHRLTGIAVR